MGSRCMDLIFNVIDAGWIGGNNTRAKQVYWVV